MSNYKRCREFSRDLSSDVRSGPVDDRTPRHKADRPIEDPFPFPAGEVDIRQIGLGFRAKIRVIGSQNKIIDI